VKQSNSVGVKGGGGEEMVGDESRRIWGEELI